MHWEWERNLNGSGARQGHRKISKKMWLRSLAQNFHVELCATDNHPSAKFWNTTHIFKISVQCESFWENSFSLALFQNGLFLWIFQASKLRDSFINNIRMHWISVVWWAIDFCKYHVYYLGSIYFITILVNLVSGIVFWKWSYSQS